MKFSEDIRTAIGQLRLGIGLLCGAGLTALFLWELRRSAFTADPMLDSYLEIAGCLIAFTFAANALVRFRARHDRLSLMLAFGFLIAGLVETAALLVDYREIVLGRAPPLRIHLAWMGSQMLLGGLMLAALVVEKRTPVAREPKRELALAILAAAAIAYLTAAAYVSVPLAGRIKPIGGFSQPWDLIPAAMFFFAAWGYARRLTDGNSVLDRALVVMAVINVVGQLAASQSRFIFDASYSAGHLLRVLSFAVVLGGALLDNGRMFEQVRKMASSDSLTGLLNYRMLMETVDAELRRSQRTGRSFAFLLFDLDGLKKINDAHGHLAGSRALKRLAYVLRTSCRSMDTAARYGGDEFALVLPEADERVARKVAGRICERLTKDGGTPPLSVSVGLAVYPTGGDSVERMFTAADSDLYRMKHRRNGSGSFSHVAACF